MTAATQSSRPSRLGTPAGVTSKADYLLEDDAGFPGLLERSWRKASTAVDLPDAVRTLLTLDGHVPAEVQLRALRTTDAAALKALCAVSWYDEDLTHLRPPPGAGDPPAFRGELALTTSGRMVARVPSQRSLAGAKDLVGGVLRVPWSAQALDAYQAEVRRAAERTADAVADCRRWLAAAGPEGRDALLGRLEEAALRTAPFVLYQEDRQYTNFRDLNTITGKTLWPGHPSCALSALHGIPLELWSDNDAVLVVCLTLLVRSAGFARIEEANGTQITVDHVAHLLERTRRLYNGVPGGREVPKAASNQVGALHDLAGALGARRRELPTDVLLYREIHGALMHKIERLAGPRGDAARRREQRLCADLGDRLPVGGATLAQLGDRLAASPGWLVEPHGDFATGLEALVFETVSGAARAFEVDFAMSRGMRSLTRFVRALDRQDWAEITGWDLPEYFCCVVPSPQAYRHFDDSPARLADVSWAISARMQYNSWHFVPGNLPKVPVVEARDHFVPPTIPDVAFFSDQHHRGHIAAQVRFSIRSPQRVDILGRTFHGFVDLRLLRCAGPPLDEQDVLAAHRASALIARATGLTADLVAEGADVEVTAFDPRWHSAIAEAAAAATPGDPPPAAAPTTPAPAGPAAGPVQRLR